MIGELERDVRAIECHALSSRFHLFDGRHAFRLHGRRHRAEILEDHVDGDRFAKLEAGEFMRVLLRRFLDGDLRRGQLQLRRSKHAHEELRGGLYLGEVHRGGSQLGRSLFLSLRPGHRRCGNYGESSKDRSSVADH